MNLVKWKEAGWFDAKNVNTQIDAGWFDWFCKDSSLVGKTKMLGAKVKRNKQGKMEWHVFDVLSNPDTPDVVGSWKEVKNYFGV